MITVYERLSRWAQEHFPVYLAAHKRLSELHFASQRDRNQDLLRTALAQELQQRGLITRFLDLENDNTFFLSAERNSTASFTLLWYIHYTARCDIFLAHLATLDAYEQMNIIPRANIKWLISIGEPLAYRSLLHVLQKHQELLQADACIWNCSKVEVLNDLGNLVNDGIPLIVLGTKGLLRMELSVRITESTAETASATAHTVPYIPSVYGNIMPNAAWRLTWALSSLKGMREEILIDGFYDTLSPADDEEVAQLHVLPEPMPMLTQAWGIENALLGLHGFQLYYTHLLIPTCTIRGINSEPSSEEAQHLNMLPVRALAQLDLYLVPDQTPEDIFAKLRRHLDAQGFTDVQARVLYACPPAHTPISTPLVTQLRHVLYQTLGREPYLIPSTAGSWPIAALQQILTLPVIIVGVENTLVQESTYPQTWGDTITMLMTIIEG